MNKADAIKLLQDELSGDNVYQLMHEIVLPALRNMEAKWTGGKTPLSYIYPVYKICEEVANTILPLGSPERKNAPVLAIATLGDEFRLGRHMVVSVLKACGFDIHDCEDMHLEHVVSKLAEDGVEIIFVSTRQPEFASKIKNLRARFEEEGINARIIVGGAPFLEDNELWKEVGADSMASDATEAVSRVFDIMLESQ